MADRDAALIHWEAGQRIQERHESYLLTLTFTLLALAVQSASFGAIFWRNNIELLGWISLLVSGLAGLSRTEWLSQLFGAQSRKDDAEAIVRRYLIAKAQRNTGVLMVEEERISSIEEEIRVAKDRAATIAKSVDELTARTQLRYKVQRIAFVIGLLCLMISRGWPALSSIVGQL